MDSESVQSSSATFWRPFLLVLCLMPLSFIIGTEYGQSAGMLPQLLKNGSSIEIDRDQATWIASVPMLGIFSSGCISGWLADKMGRLRTCQISYMLMIAGFGVMVTADGFKSLVLGRYLTGLSMGSSHSSQVYISEISPPKHRGVLLSLPYLLSAFGIVFMYVVGGYLPWRIGARISCILGVIGLIISLFFFDTPVWLVRKNKINAARKSLERIEGTRNVHAKLRQLINTANSKQETKFSFNVFAKPTVWKPFILVNLLSVLQNTSGYYIVVAYSVQIMQEFHSTFDPLESTVAVGVVKLFAMIITSYLLRHMGRKLLGALSGFSSAVMLILLYAYLMFEGEVSYLRESTWIPIGLFLLYIMAITLGISPLPWTIIFEIYPLNVRGMMAGMSFCTMHMLVFFAVKSYNLLLVNLGIRRIILMFAICSFAFGLFSAMILVETHNKTLDEVEEAFVGKKKTKNEAECVSLGQKTPSETLLGDPSVTSKVCIDS